jgi:hypothetical protein
VLDADVTEATGMRVGGTVLDRQQPDLKNHDRGVS